MAASAGAVVADGTPDFPANEISKQDSLFPTSLRHARVFSDGTFDFRQSVFKAMKKLPAGQFGFTDNKNIAIVDPMLMSYVQGLNNLQHSSRGQLLAASIAIPTKHWLDFIPPSAKDKIDYLTPHELEFHQLFNRGSGAGWRNTMNNITADLSTMTRLFGNFFEREYSIFNWNTGGHWGSSLIHKQRGKDGRWNRIAHIAVLDPLQSSDTIQFVRARLRAVLRFIGCTIARGEIGRTFWFPRKRDGYSCGVYAANLNRILIDRIADLYLPSGPNAYNDAALWQPAREYFDPRQFQGEMQGLVGLTLVRELEYKARLAVAIVDKTTNIAVDTDDYEALAVGPDPTEFSLTRGGKPRPQTRKTTSTQQKATFLEGLGNKISKTLQGKGDKAPTKRPRTDDDDDYDNDSSGDYGVKGSPTKKQKPKAATAPGAATGPHTHAASKTTNTTSSKKRVIKKLLLKKK